MMHVLATVSIYGFAGLLVWAAVSDFGTFIIPNRICVALVVLYPAYVLAASVSAAQPVPWIGALFTAAGVFLAGLFLFAARAMGGGDVKLMSSTALWAGTGLIVPFLIVTVLAGAVLAGVVAVRICVNAVREGADGVVTPGALVLGIANIRHVPLAKVQVPYGVAVATGGLYVAFRLLSG